MNLPNLDWRRYVFAIKSFDENNVKITVDTIVTISESKNSPPDGAGSSGSQ
jgi:hypothetical protein